MRLRGWKVRDGLTWRQEAPKKGLAISSLWKDNCMVKHDDNKFLPTQLLPMAETTQIRLMRLYDWMAARTPLSRGGRLDSPCPAVELYHATYIWKAFRTQGWESWKSGAKRLTCKNMIP
ncbi:hypothetical protein FRB90_003832 [Tulasnella sp. 427]|nr:hypothetical protein FRB90_003832 [Tulasnella sp. 427]